MLRQIQNLYHAAHNFIALSLTTTHGKVILAGLAVVCLLYFPAWAWLLLVFTGGGASFPILAGTAVFLGLSQLWQQRESLSRLRASKNYRRFGHFLIIFGITLFPFARYRLWSQALACLFILVGGVISSWGLQFFPKHWLSVFLILLGFYPSTYTLVSNYAWKLLTPPELLEQSMAWAGGKLLGLLGYPAISDRLFIYLGNGGVEVYQGCSGFDKAVTMIGLSVLVGIIFHLNIKRTVVLTFASVALALILNVIRIALMTLATAYWGDQVFDFWHGSWGGQIIVGVLFTAYYYLIIWILPQSTIPTSGHNLSD